MGCTEVAGTPHIMLEFQALLKIVLPSRCLSFPGLLLGFNGPWAFISVAARQNLPSWDAGKCSFLAGPEQNGITGPKDLGGDEVLGPPFNPLAGLF